MSPAARCDESMCEISNHWRVDSRLRFAVSRSLRRLAYIPWIRWTKHPAFDRVTSSGSVRLAVTGGAEKINGRGSSNLERGMRLTSSEAQDIEWRLLDVAYVCSAPSSEDLFGDLTIRPSDPRSRNLADRLCHASPQSTRQRGAHPWIHVASIQAAIGNLLWIHYHGSLRRHVNHLASDWRKRPVEMLN